MSGFQFKQFFIEHSRCAMKVGTDSIMLGSWAEPGHASNILDIGTGSGLLAIMLAQRASADAQILGVDVAEQAILQARINAKNSPWASQLHFLHSPIQKLSLGRQMDVIISNPPYFEGKQGELSVGDPHFIAAERRMARHTVSLSLAELIRQVARLLADAGCFYCVVPQSVMSPLCDLAQRAGLYCRRRMEVQSTPDKPVSRSLLAFEKDPGACQLQALVIRDGAGDYTEAYRNLCREYYLNF